VAFVMKVDIDGIRWVGTVPLKQRMEEDLSSQEGIDPSAFASQGKKQRRDSGNSQ
jgi:hypothetical protein